MKTTAILASAALCASTALAADASYFTLGAYTGTKTGIDNKPLKPENRFFMINGVTDSNCGDVSPVVTVNSNGVLAFYNTDTSKAQIGYIDISGAADGLFAYSPAGSASSTATPDTITDKFTIQGAEQDQLKLYYDGDAEWLACPDGDNSVKYYIYPAKAYAKSTGKDRCVSFEILASPAAEPETVCVYN